MNFSRLCCACFVVPNGFAHSASCALVALGILAVCPIPIAWGIDIQFSYDETDRPAFDPAGTRLRAIFSAAETYYESILLQPVVYSFEIWWEDLEDSNDTLGETFINPFETDIALDTALNGVPREWFFDPTPLDHSEFQFDVADTQTLYRDLTPTLQGEWFNGQVPGELEVGYRAFAIPGTAPDGKYDLFSTVIHEIGHVLGIHSEIIDDQNEYEFRASQVGGSTNAAAAEDPNDDGHLSARTALMCGGCGALSLRRLPTAADLLALDGEIPIPTGVPNTLVRPDLPRVNFIGVESTDWNGTLNWIGGRVPDDNNHVLVRHGGTVTVPGDYSTAKDVLIDRGSTLQTLNNNLLRVFGTLEVGDYGDSQGQLHIGTVLGIPRLETENLYITDGLVELHNTSAVINVSRSLNLSNRGILQGAGTVEIAGTLSNGGEISAGTFLLFSYGGELALRTVGTGRVDLDGGTEAGRLTATNGDLRIASTTDEPFNGTATVGVGRKLRFDFPWRMDGNLQFHGGSSASSAASLAGGEVLVSTRIDVDGHARIEAPLVLYNDASINLPDAGDTLTLAGPLTEINNGAFRGGAGTVFVNGNMDVRGSAYVDVSTFDMDGSDSGNTMQLLGGRLTIFGQSVESSVDNDGYDDTLIIRDNGLLQVNTPAPWRLDNKLVLYTGDGVTTGGSSVEGAELIVQPGGVIESRQFGFPAREVAWIKSPLRLEGTSSINAIGGILTLANVTTLNGGTISGTAQVSQAGPLIVEAYSAVNVASYRWGLGDPNHTTIVRPNAQLQMAPAQIGRPGLPEAYAGHIILERDAVLTVFQTAATSWSLTGTIDLQGGLIFSQDLVSTGTIGGKGTILIDRLENSGIVAPGNSIGTLELAAEPFFGAGHYVQTPSGRLEIEVGSLSSRVPNDVLRAGAATLAGTVAIELLEGFLPTPGSRFDFLIAPSIVGTFTTLELIAPIGVIFNGHVLYSSNRVTFEVLAASLLPGDYNQNGIVDVADYTVWRDNLGSNTSLFGDDTPGVGPDDYVRWKTHFGETSGSGAGPSPNVAVPEPTTAVMLIVSMLSIFSRPRTAASKTHGSMTRVGNRPL